MPDEERKVRKIRLEKKEENEGISVALESSGGLGEVWVKLGQKTSSGRAVTTYARDVKTGQRYHVFLGWATEVKD